jgi:hypothetical protein
MISDFQGYACSSIRIGIRSVYRYIRRFSDQLFLDLDNNVSFYINHEDRGAKGWGFEW